MRFFGVLTLLVFGASGAAAADQGRSRVLLLPIHPESDGDAPLARTIDRLVLVAAQGFRGIEVVSPEDIKVAMEIERQKDVAGCSSEIACYAEIAAALSADRVLRGTLDRLGGVPHVVLQLFDMRKQSVENAVDTQLPTMTEAQEAIRTTVGRLFGGKPIQNAAVEVRTGPPGELWIRTNPPGARVFIDAEPRGVTPIRLPGVPAGAHQVVLKLDGYIPLTRDAVVAPNETLDVNEALALLRGDVEIDSTPRGAACTLDGVLIGATPCRRSAVPAGDRRLVLHLDHYRALETRLEVAGERLNSRHFDLVPEPVNVTIASSPSGAQVFLDGEKVGETDYSTQLLPRNYRIKLVKGGYEDVEHEINVAVGHPFFESVPMEPGLSVTERGYRERMRIVRWGLTAIAAGATGIWVWQGIRARNIKSDIESRTFQDPETDDLVASGKRAAVIADVALGAAILSASGAAVLWVTGDF